MGRKRLRRETSPPGVAHKKLKRQSQGMARKAKRIIDREREPQQGPSTEASTEEVDGGPSPTTGSQSTDVQSTALRGDTEPTEEMGLQQNPLRRGWREGGYKCKFVKPPPNTDQSKCSVCLLILCDPHQVTCCGYSFCQTCINRVRLNNDPCPTCNEEGFMTFPDKRLQRSLNQLKVHCPHEGSGCEWTGELGKLDKHLNENPVDISNHFHGCQYAMVNCIYCAVPFQRYVGHQLRDCPQRPYSCDYCKEYKASFDDVINQHHPVCKRYPLSCPNKCDHTIERQNLEHHVKEECPLTVVECDFHYAGCGVKLPRKDIAGHLAGSLVAHMSLLAVHGKKIAADAQKTAVDSQKALEERDKQIVQMREEIKKLERENKALKERADANFDRLHSHLHTPPVTFTMTNFEQHKRNKDTWSSPPFYTHPHGYKMCVKVMCEDDSCFFGAILMHGEFDDCLHWPFQSTVYIRILNQLEDDDHINIAGDFSCGPNVGMRVTVGERHLKGYGDDIPYATLNCHGDSTENCQYLRDDCVQLQVARVVDTVQLQREIVATVDHRSVRTPPCQFIMRDFEQHKKDGDKWYFPSFFTHPQGYRMCLRVDADGFGDGRGTHVSIFTNLMCGEFDSHLKWPFRGDITIQLLNQLEDKQHHTMTIRYTDTTPDDNAGRVTVGERGGAWGKHQFIPHSELGLNRSRNCHYLKDGCLIFKITKIDLKL